MIVECCWTAARDVPVGKGQYSYQTHASLVWMVYRHDAAPAADTKQHQLQVDIDTDRQADRQIKQYK